MSESNKTLRKVRKRIIKTYDTHVGSVRRSEVRISDSFFYQGTCSCGYGSTATSEVKMAAAALEQHIKDEVLMSVS